MYRFSKERTTRTEQNSNLTEAIPLKKNNPARDCGCINQTTNRIVMERSKWKFSGGIKRIRIANIDSSEWIQELDISL